MHWQPEGLHGDEGEEVEHPVLLEEISWVLKVSGLPVAVSSLPYPTIPYPISPKSRAKTWFHRQLLKSKSKVLLLQLPS